MAVLIHFGGAFIKTGALMNRFTLAGASVNTPGFNKIPEGVTVTFSFWLTKEKHYSFLIKQSY
ncbi:MAG TPA: hypothetical protein VLB84_19475 [Bacteroidia bacterium]|jgi:hypothetical protein|nr:hypothetical protein [Bacteroidia bacterium]